MPTQLPLFAFPTSIFPSTRYQGSKAKLVDWIWQQLQHLKFQTCLDAFGGTAAVAYRLKQAGKQITYNDGLRFNQEFGKALIENAAIRLDATTVEWLMTAHPDVEYPSFIQETFHDIYFTDEENGWIDRVLTNMRRLSDPYHYSLAFFALAQACIVKRPYNLFHRRNLYIRFAEVERSFGNKASWDKPFADWFRGFVEEANAAIFDNGETNQAVCYDALEIPGDYDLVYIDPPYLNANGVGTDYHAFYHFLEGLTMYDNWQQHVDFRSKHRRLKPVQNDWTDRKRIYQAFERLFERYQSSILVVSYRSDGIPSVSELEHLLSRFKSNVQHLSYGQYQYALSTNTKSSEILLIGT